MNHGQKEKENIEIYQDTQAQCCVATITIRWTVTAEIVQETRQWHSSNAAKFKRTKIDVPSESLLAYRILTYVSFK